MLPVMDGMALMNAPKILRFSRRNSLDCCSLNSCPTRRSDNTLLTTTMQINQNFPLSRLLVLPVVLLVLGGTAGATIAQQFKPAPENHWRPVQSSAGGAVELTSTQQPTGSPAINGRLGSELPSALTAIQDSGSVDDQTQNQDQFISQGELFEREGRWGEALTLYQNAVKQQPDNLYLKRKRNVARLHFDLDRRYGDSSYIQTLQKSDGSTALQVYSDILAKVQSYYVDQPNWQALTNYGAASLELALQNPSFQRKNLGKADPERVRLAVAQLRQSLQSFPVSSRQEALVAASGISRAVNEASGVPVQSCVYEFISGAIVALDPYSSFMTASQYSETMSQIEGNFVGLGVELKTHEEHLEIVDVLEGGSAHKAGMAAGDLILAVDGKAVPSVGSEAAADLLRGPEDSFVEIVVERPDKQRYRLNLQRRRVEIASVESVQIVDEQNGVGYIRLTNFQKTTPADFDKALWKLHRAGMQSLIVDVRRNPGGLLTASVEVADRFVSEGIIVSTRGRNPMEDFTHKAKVAGTWRMPLIVLIDENSASASEIFAAAISDNQRGVIVGSQSYGKGSVQGIFPINVSNGGVRLTTAKFYSPRGVAISQRGVKPNVEVHSVLKPAEIGNNLEQDAVLKTAMNVARRQLQQNYSSTSRN